jgi:hypothetical protein
LGFCFSIALWSDFFRTRLFSRRWTPPSQTLESKKAKRKNKMAKSDALAAQAVADGVLYDAGFSDGVASVQSPTGDVTAAQEQLDIAAAVASAVAPLNAQISALQLAATQEQALLASVEAAAQSLISLLAPTAPSA